MVIFDDSLSPQFQDYSWGSYFARNTFPVYQGQYSIKFTCINFQGLYFSHHSLLDRNLFEGISFYVYGANNNLSPAITLQLSREDALGGPTMKLVSISSPFTSATGLSSLEYNRWVKAYIPFPNDGQMYSGIRIMSDTSQGSDIYFDNFQVESVGNNLPRPYPAPVPHPQPGTVDNGLLVPGAIFKVVDAQADPRLGGVEGGHSFWTSLKIPELNYQTRWSFNDDARMFVLSNQNLLMTGSFSGGGCWNWQANIEFIPWPGTHDIKMELAPEAYTPYGPINVSTWKFYLLRSQTSYWAGTGCNSGSMVQLTGLEYHMPMMIGYGANGKNGNFGISVWLTYKTNGLSVGPPPESVPIDLNVDLIPISKWSGKFEIENKEILNEQDQKDIKE